MGQRLKAARGHVHKIEYYHKQAGELGYSQARYHWDTLTAALRAATISNTNQGDGIVIAAMIEAVRPKMEEMKQWQENAGKGEQRDKH